jgi:hypothetical protein
MVRSDLVCLVAPMAILAVAGCSRPPVPAAPTLPPEAEPAEPRDWGGQEEMNTEFFMGSKAEETAQFESFAKEISDIQTKQAKDHSQPVERGFHAKAHGCLWGHVEPWPNRDPRTRFGVFAEPGQSRPVWVRFSNGVGWSQGDSKLDARGMAVKVMNVEGRKYAPDEEHTQDFLMTNTPTPVGRNGEQFMSFARANAAGLFPSLLFLVTHPRSGAPALLRTNAISSTVTEQYWGGAAYHLGAHQAVKFTAKPCACSPPRSTVRDDPDYLREDLVWAARGGVCYTFFVQFQVNPVDTPIEDAAREWSEEVSPPVPVANIVLPPQEFDTPAEREFCQSLSFSPWHSVPAHKPMGHINRARRYVYAASRAFRHGGHEPTGFEGFDGPAHVAGADTRTGQTGQ